MNEINVALTNDEIDTLLCALSIASHECLILDDIIDSLYLKLKSAQERVNNG